MSCRGQGRGHRTRGREASCQEAEAEAGARFSGSSGPVESGNSKQKSNDALPKCRTELK